MNLRLLCFVFVILSFNVFSQGLFETATADSEKTDETADISIGGYGRGIAYGGAEDYDYSSVFGEISLQTRLSRGSTFFYADLRVREGMFFNKRKTVVDLKEAYAAYRSPNFSFFVGNQVVAWGRTDGYNPTDNITPYDYFLLTPDFDDQRMSSFLLRSRVSITDNSEIDLVFIPVFRQSNYRYDLFQMGSEARFNQPSMPDTEFKNGSFGARLNFNYPVAGFSFSYFHGYDPFYGFRVENIQFFPVVRIDYLPDFYKKHTIGADFELPLQNSVFRAEIAYNNTSDYHKNMHIPNPDLYYVAGVEKSIFNIIAIMQYVGKYTIDYKTIVEPVAPESDDQAAQMEYGKKLINYQSELFNRRIFSQQEKTNHAIMISLNRQFAYETVNAELTAYYNITSEEYLVRPAVLWRLTDQLSASLGAHFMFGPDDSIYNYAAKIFNGVFIGFKSEF